MKGFIKKILFRFIAMFIACTILLNSLTGTYFEPQQQEAQAAVVPVVWSLWEIIELFILSTGCTYLLYEMFTGLVDGTSALDSTAEDVMADYNEWVVLQGGKGSGDPEGDDEEPPLLSEEIIVEMVRQLDDGRVVVDVSEDLYDSLQQYVSEMYGLAQFQSGVLDTDYLWNLTGIDLNSFDIYTNDDTCALPVLERMEQDFTSMQEFYSQGYDHVYLMEASDKSMVQLCFFKINNGTGANALPDEIYYGIKNHTLKLTFDFLNCDEYGYCRVYVVNDGILMDVSKYISGYVYLYGCTEYSTGKTEFYACESPIYDSHYNQGYARKNWCGSSYNVLFSDGIPGIDCSLQIATGVEALYSLKALYNNNSYDIGATGRSWNVNEQTVDGDMTLVLPSTNTLMSYLSGEIGIMSYYYEAGIVPVDTSTGMAYIGTTEVPLEIPENPDWGIVGPNVVPFPEVNPDPEEPGIIIPFPGDPVEPSDPEEPDTENPDPEEPEEPDTENPDPEEPEEPDTENPDPEEPEEPDTENPDPEEPEEPDTENPNPEEPEEPDTENPNPEEPKEPEEPAPGLVPDPGVLPDYNPDSEPSAEPEPEPGLVPDPGVLPEANPNDEPATAPEPAPELAPGLVPDPGVLPEADPNDEPATAPELAPGLAPDPGVLPNVNPNPDEATMPDIEAMPDIPLPDISDLPDVSDTANSSKLKEAGLLLKEVFPFCIPFDIYDAIKMMVAERKAPAWDVDINFPLIDYTYHFSVDMADYEGVVNVFRWGWFLLFVIGLMMNTHKFIKWKGR